MEKNTEFSLGFAALMVVLSIGSAIFGQYTLAGKFLGVFLIMVAIFLIVYFPATVKEPQIEEFSKTGIIIGVILFFVGVGLIFFV